MKSSQIEYTIMPTTSIAERQKANLDRSSRSQDIGGSSPMQEDGNREKGG
jgi:hypothetical protein